MDIKNKSSQMPTMTTTTKIHNYIGSLVFRERPLYLFAYQPCEKKLLKTGRNTWVFLPEI